VEPAEFWTTISTDNNCAKQRGCHNYLGVARLKDGVSPASTLADITTIALQLTKQYPDSNTDRHAYLLPLADLIVGDIRPILLVLLGGAALLLLIASMNVASLLLVRAESRRREIAVRGALGASRLRLLRQFVTEGVVLAAAGSVLGLTGAYGAMRSLAKFIPTDMMASMPYLRGLGLNLHVIVFACAISLAAAVLFSLTPVRLSWTAIRAGLTDGGRGAAGTTWRRFGSNLVVVELAAAMVLLVGAGLLGKSFYRLLHVDTGMEPDHLAAIAVVTPASAYAKDTARIALERQILARVTRLPGVTSAGITSDLPVGDGDGTTTFRIPGRPYRVETNEVNDRMVSADYFATVQARLLRGRYFLETEDASKPRVVIVNEALAKRYFPGQDPIGQRIGDDQLSAGSLKEIIGVVDDIKEGPLDMTARPAYYQPFNQETQGSFYLVVRTVQAEASLFPALTAAIHEIDPGIATYGAVTMSERIHDSPSAYLHRSSAYVVGGFAGMALVLGVVGLYGVIAYSVSQRTREIGVRMALGAQRGSVYQLILKEAAWLTALGIGAGLVCSIATAMLTRKLLYGVAAWDVATFVAVAVVLGAAAMLASYLPARRAASVNPVEALRAE
jgi:predicted permease